MSTDGWVWLVLGLTAASLSATYAVIAWRGYRRQK